MMSAQNIKITSVHIATIIILISTKFSISEIFFFPGCAIKSGRIKLNNKMKAFPPGISKMSKCELTLVVKYKSRFWYLTECTEMLQPKGKGPC